eukprot:CAMPEP_0172368064 /NCGR_PEP_ID=MMETSP1060-20121228/24890_1 /TAXON_ID=37318 /ORGANISM="Pseudo-nitzschia pungens, Strain cf. cingulata" /LENGTH=491 /DNA_ID=CAMNT_0013092521 /DNA_START=96 /DNA_END=1571 /DNA_ORIENTATION=+
MRNLLFFVFVVLVVELSLVVLTDSLLQPTQLGLVDSVPRLPNTAGTEPTDLLFLSKTPSSSPSTSPSPNSSHKNTGNIFVRFDGDEHHGDSFSSSSSFSFRDEARNVATTLGIPFLSAAEASDRRGEPFTHALMLMPYDCGTKESTFALAIEPFDSSSSSSSSSRKQQRSRRKRSKTKPSSSSSAFFVDLCPPSGSPAGKRAAGASGTSDLLVKAVGPRKGIEARDGRQTQTRDGTQTRTRTGNGNGKGAVVWDLTAGLGQDSLVLARNGARRVRMVERHPVVAALLGDALRRLECIANTSASATATANASATANAPESSSSSRSKLAASLLDTLDLTVGDGRDVLREHHNAECENDNDTYNDSGTYNNGCDVVYLDPMFPPRQKSSAVKKGMSILHGLLLETHVPNKNNNNKVNNNNDDGDDAKEQTETETARQTEEQELLESATSVARLRVVVKRPIKAPPLGDGSKKPSYAVEGSTNRWDVYVSPKPA